MIAALAGPQRRPARRPRYFGADGLTARTARSGWAHARVSAPGVGEGPRGEVPSAAPRPAARGGPRLPEEDAVRGQRSAGRARRSRHRLWPPPLGRRRGGKRGGGLRRGGRRPAGVGPTRCTAAPQSLHPLPPQGSQRSPPSLSCGAGCFHAGLCSPLLSCELFGKLLEPNACHCSVRSGSGEGGLRLELSPAGCSASAAFRERQVVRLFYFYFSGLGNVSMCSLESS